MGDELTNRHGTDPFSPLLQADRPEQIARVRRALDEAGIPYRSGLLADRPPRVIFSVPRDLVEEARDVVEEYAGTFEAPARFPWRPVRFVASVIGVHFVLVAWLIGKGPSGLEFLRQGGLLKGAMAEEPWRLLTSLFLHSDPTHVFWNGASMMVFAVPLLTDLRYVRTCLIYLAAGVGGGITALWFAGPGTVIVGSSGAVAGLFGAWIVLALRRARREAMTRRARVRTLGIALLVLPSLLSPISSTGQPVSVGSHLGGLATGMLIGASISGGMLSRGERRDEDFGDPDASRPRSW